MQPIRSWIEATTWNDDLMEAYLRPYWSTREVYNETAAFIGEEASVVLMYTPTEVHSVRSYDLSITYEEGKDYRIEGKRIVRVKGGAIPYWEPDDYFPPRPNIESVPIGLDPRVSDFDFEGQRYLRYGETDTFTKMQVAITYRHADAYTGPVYTHQPEKLARLLGKMERKETIRIMVYGDSVAVGCNASGTQYGGNINPHMPNSPTMVAEYIRKHTDCEVLVENMAVGGWNVKNCIDAYDERIAGKDIDLLILRIGGNDAPYPKEKFTSEMTELLAKFFADHPDANVILQTPDLPNMQSGWVLNAPYIEDWTHEVMEASPNAGQIAFVPVTSFTAWLVNMGKHNRNFLANNINHGNDFIIRVYAQGILMAIFGDAFAER